MKRKPKIACVCADPDIAINGWKKNGSLRVQRFVAGLVAEGCEVHLFATNVRYARVAALSGAHIHPLAIMPKDHGRLSRRKVSLMSNGDLRSSLDEFGPYDLVLEWFSLISREGMRYAVERGIPGFLHIGTSTITKLDRYKRLADAKSMQDYANCCFGDATALISSAHDVAKYLQGFEATADKINSVDHGLLRKTECILPKERMCEQTGVFAVGYFGGLDANHPVNDVVQSFECFQQQRVRSRLVLVGSGDGRRSVVEQLHAKGLSSISTVVGSISSNEAWALKRRMDVIIVPTVPWLSRHTSTDRLVEHMSSGAVVIAADCEQTRSVIDDGVTGVLYKAGDTLHLTEILMNLYNYPLSARAISERARAHTGQNYSIERSCQNILSMAKPDINNQFLPQASAVHSASM